MRRTRKRWHPLRWMLCAGALLLVLLAIYTVSSNGLDTEQNRLLDRVAAALTLEPSSSPSDAALASEDLPWYLILVNRDNPIPDNYEVELTTLANGQQVDTRIYPALQAMFDDMRAQGVYPTVAAGYRTWEKQQSLLDEKIAEYEAAGNSAEDARTLAESWVAVPGTSEHQLGIAVDINADPNLSTADQVYSWLAENAYKYGFIQRYPGDKTDITGVINEPWHYRYVGEEAAAEIYAQGVCLEEYLPTLAQGELEDAA